MLPIKFWSKIQGKRQLLRFRGRLEGDIKMDTLKLPSRLHVSAKIDHHQVSDTKIRVRNFSTIQPHSLVIQLTFED
jgi:hypothetical protein